MDQSDKLVNQQQCEAVLWHLPGTASNANMLSQNNFFKPNWQAFTILHVVWVRMLLRYSLHIYIYITFHSIKDPVGFDGQIEPAPTSASLKDGWLVIWKQFSVGFGFHS